MILKISMWELMRDPCIIYIKLINGKDFKVIIKKIASFACFFKKFEQGSSYNVTMSQDIEIF